MNKMKLVINCGKKVEEKAMDFEEKSLLVNKLLKLAKTSKLSNNQKKNNINNSWIIKECYWNTKKKVYIILSIKYSK